MQTPSSDQPAVRTTTTTVWLWIVIVLNAVVGLLALIGFGAAVDQGVSPLFLAISILLILGVAVGAFMILQWKKMGFYICAGCMVLNVLMSLFTGDFVNTLIRGIVAIGVLYYVLQYPKDNKAWNHLT